MWLDAVRRKGGCAFCLRLAHLSLRGRELGWATLRSETGARVPDPDARARACVLHMVMVAAVTTHKPLMT